MKTPIKTPFSQSTQSCQVSSVIFASETPTKWQAWSVALSAPTTWRWFLLGSAFLVSQKKKGATILTIEQDSLTSIPPLTRYPIASMKVSADRFLSSAEPEKSVINLKGRLQRPSRAKRSISLPADLKFVAQSSTKLFWFIPASRRRIGNETSKREDDGSFAAKEGMNSRSPEPMAAQWARRKTGDSDDDATSTGTDEYDEQEEELLGIAFLDSISVDEAEADS